LPEGLLGKTFDFCAMKDWKLSSQDTGTKDPDFNELKKFILGKALSAKKKVVYNKERATEGYNELKELSTAIAKAPPTPTTSPVSSNPTPNSDLTIIELTKQLANLTLMVQATMNPQTAAAQSKPSPVKTTDRIYRCVWCDSASHSRKADCPDLGDAVKRGLVAINVKGRIVNTSTGEEIPPMYGKGGMKKIFELAITVSAIVSTNVIMLDEKPVYGTLGSEGTVHVTTINLETGKEMEEIIDMDVYEKRTRDDIL